MPFINLKASSKAGRVLGIAPRSMLQVPNWDGSGGSPNLSGSWWNFAGSTGPFAKKMTLNRSTNSNVGSNGNSAFFYAPYVAANSRSITPNLTLPTQNNGNSVLGASIGGTSGLPGTYLAQAARDLYFNISLADRSAGKSSVANSSSNSGNTPATTAGNVNSSTVSGSSPSIKLPSKDYVAKPAMFELPPESCDQPKYPAFHAPKLSTSAGNSQHAVMGNSGPSNLAATTNRRISFMSPLVNLPQQQTVVTSRTTLPRSPLQRGSLDRNKRMSVVSVTAIALDDPLDAANALPIAADLSAKEPTRKTPTEETSEHRETAACESDVAEQDSEELDAVDDFQFAKSPKKAVQLALLKGGSLVPNLVPQILEQLVKQWRQAQANYSERSKSEASREEAFLLNSQWKGEIVGKALYERYQRTILEALSEVNSYNRPVVGRDASAVVLFYICWSGEQHLLQKLIQIFGPSSNWPRAETFNFTETELSLRKRELESTRSETQFTALADVRRTDSDAGYSATPSNVETFSAISTNDSLFTSSFDWNVKDDEGRTPIMLAAIRGHDRCVELLVDLGVPLYLKDRYNQTVVHWAARMGQTSVLRVLLKRGVASLLSAQDNRGYTPLHSAVLSDNEHCLSFLISQALSNQMSSLLCHRDFSDMTAFELAISLNKVSFVKLYIGAYSKAKVSLTDLSADRRTALHYAALYGNHPMIFKLLFKYYGDLVHTVDGEGKTPMMAACESGNYYASSQFINYLRRQKVWKKSGNFFSLRKRLDPSRLQTEISVQLQTETDLCCRTVLHLAAAASMEASLWLVLEFAEFALRMDSSRMKEWVNKQDCYGATALHYAVRTGNMGIVQGLLIKQCDPLVVDSKKRSPLMWATMSSVSNMVHLLLFSPFAQKFYERPSVYVKSSVEQRDEEGATALHFAASTGDFKSCQYLVCAGAEVAALDNQMHTPLFKAAVSGKPALLEFLLDEFEDWRCSQQEDYQTLVMELEAAKEGKGSDSEAVVASLKNKAERFMYSRGMDDQDVAGRTMLHWCANLGHLDCLSLLCNRGAAVNVTDHSKSTPLHEAASSGNYSAALLLMQYGADVAAIDGGGCTPLHWAATNKHVEVCQLLVNQGAKINAMEVSADKDTPLDYAMLSENNEKVVSYLIAAGGVTFQDLKLRAALLIQRVYRMKKAKLRVPIAFLLPKLVAKREELASH